jgi:hypothetical protein
MASIQKMSSLGHRIYWELYFPDGTSREKYKASSSNFALQEILLDKVPKSLIIKRNIAST